MTRASSCGIAEAVLPSSGGALSGRDSSNKKGCSREARCSADADCCYVVIAIPNPTDLVHPPEPSLSAVGSHGCCLRRIIPTASSQPHCPQYRNKSKPLQPRPRRSGHIIKATSRQRRRHAERMLGEGVVVNVVVGFVVLFVVVVVIGALLLLLLLSLLLLLLFGS